MPKAKPITTRINAALKRAGREERFYRGAGYYYVSGSVRASGLYIFRLDNESPEDLRTAVEYVQDVLREEGTPVDLSALLADER